jgi:hypothetical protein
MPTSSAPPIGPTHMSGKGIRPYAPVNVRGAHDGPSGAGRAAAARRSRGSAPGVCASRRQERLLRQALEARLSSDSLFWLLPAAVKTWKVRSPLMVGEAYARGLLACRCERLQPRLTSPWE